MKRENVLVKKKRGKKRNDLLTNARRSVACSCEDLRESRLAPSTNNKYTTDKCNQVIES